MRFTFAPMEGITSYIYRNAFQEYYGGVEAYYTPFISNVSFSHKEKNEILPEHNKGLRVIPQILSNNADHFLAITKKLANLGYDEVNLNLGCPSGTVVAKRRGAGFLYVPDELDAFLDKVYEQSPLPISIKTRIGMNSTDEWEGILDIFRQYPVKELIVHPRIKKELYNGEPHIDAYKKAAESLPFPVAYNGDITDEAGYKRLLEAAPDTSCVMIGRGLLRNPELALILSGSEPTYDMERFQAFHDRIFDEYKEEMSGDTPLLFHMKELMLYMCDYLKADEKTVKRIRKTGSLAEYRSIVYGLTREARL